MLYIFLVSKKGFTLIEILTVVVVLSILVAVSVPIFTANLNKKRVEDCKSNREAIQGVLKRVMLGQMDNGKPQKVSYKFYKIQEDTQIEITRAEYLKINFENSKKIYNYQQIPIKKENEKLMLFFDKPYTSLTKINYNGKEVNCFKLTNNKKEKNLIFTLSDIRGGWHGSIDYNNFKNSEIFTDYEDDYLEDCKVSYMYNGEYDENGNFIIKNEEKANQVDVNSRYFLKNRKKGAVPFYTYLYNQEIPVCPFADYTDGDKSNDYYYYILEDATVICTCPNCI